MNIDWVQIILAVVTGVFASLTFFIITLCMRPRIKISKYICFGKDNSKDTYYIKVINKSRFSAVDVQYTLSYVTKRSDGKTIIKTINPLQTDDIHTIERYRPIYYKKNKSYDNCYQISYAIPVETYPVLEDNQELNFTFVARHALSGTIACVQQKFDKNSFKKDSQHVLGMSLDYLKND